MNYFTYGGMPRLLSFHTHEEKSKYLKELFSKTYSSDVVERNQISNDIDVLDDLLNIVSSSIGSLTNPNKLSNTYRSIKHVSIGNHTISKYLDYLMRLMNIKGMIFSLLAYISMPCLKIFMLLRMATAAWEEP